MALDHFSSSLAEELAQATSDLIELGSGRAAPITQQHAAPPPPPPLALSPAAHAGGTLGHALSVPSSARLTPVFDDEAGGTSRQSRLKSSPIASSSRIVLERSEDVDEEDDDEDDTLPSAGLSQSTASVKAKLAQMKDDHLDDEQHAPQFSISTFPSDPEFDRRYSPFLESHKALMRRRMLDGSSTLPLTCDGSDRRRSTSRNRSSIDENGLDHDESGTSSGKLLTYDLSDHGMRRGNDANVPDFFRESFPDMAIRDSSPHRRSEDINDRMDETTAKADDNTLPSNAAFTPVSVPPVIVTTPAPERANIAPAISKNLLRPKAVLALASNASDRRVTSVQQSYDSAAPVKLYGNRRRQREAQAEAEEQDKNEVIHTSASPSPVPSPIGTNANGRDSPALARAAALFSTPLVPSREEETIAGRDLSNTAASSRVDLATSALLSSPLGDSDNEDADKGERVREAGEESTSERASLSSLPATSLKTSSSQSQSLSGTSPSSPGRIRRRRSTRSRSSFSASSQRDDVLPSGSEQPGPFTRDVKLGRFSVVGDKSRGYVCYEVRIITTTGTTMSILRRFSDFVRLRQALIAECSQISSTANGPSSPSSSSSTSRGGKRLPPPLPPKRTGLFHKYASDYLEKRRRGLQQWLVIVMLDPKWGVSQALRQWVLSD